MEGLPSHDQQATRTAATADREPLYELAYRESQRNLTQQAGVLDNLRTRAGLIIVAANVVTALLGAPAITNATAQATGGNGVPGLSLGAVLAVLCFAIVGLATLLILRPLKGWIFRFGAKEIIDRVDDGSGMTLGRAHRRLAILNEESFLTNESKLDKLFLCLEVSAVFLCLEALFWVASLAHLRIFDLQF